ncbi:MAG: hypothetical protein ACI8W8_004341 [Rhodothermales bacterium]|jgi:hypothetical protein
MQCDTKETWAMKHLHTDEEAVMLLARYRARKMREHMMGPGVSFIFHMALLILLVLFAGGHAPPPEKNDFRVTMIPPEIYQIPIPPEPDDDPLPTPTLPTPAPPPTMPEAPSMTAPEDPGEPDTTDDMPELVDSTLDMLAHRDLAPITSPAKIPGLYTGRGDKRRKGMVTRGEMPKSGQDAVQRALRWLARVQMDDGSWERGPAITGLALLCFLAHGDTPMSEEFGITVQKSMQWLAATMPADGRPVPGKHGGVYDHGIVTYALCEAYGMTRIPMLRVAAENGLAVIIKGQQCDGGWNYNYDDKGRWDLSVSAWQMQALKAGYVAGLESPGLCDAMELAKAFTARASNGETFGYSKPVGSRNLTGAGTLCLQILGAGKSGAAVAGTEYLMDTRLAKFAAARNDWKAQGGPLYGWYYDTQAAFHAGRKSWEAWRRVFDPVLTQNQHPDGYWDVEAAHAIGSPLAEDVYHTTLCCLQLEVYYRYLPSMTLKRNCDSHTETARLLTDDLSIMTE